MARTVAHSSAVRPRGLAATGTAATAIAAGRRRPAGLVKVPDVGGEARVVERPLVEPGAELAEGRDLTVQPTCRAALRSRNAVANGRERRRRHSTKSHSGTGGGS